MSDREIVDRLIANDKRMIKDFFFIRCSAALTYIGRHYCNERQTSEELIGEFYEFLSADDWHKLRIFNFTCSLNSYVTIIASRYFQSKRNREMVSLDEKIELLRRAGSNNIKTGFVMNDVQKVIDTLCPLDRFLVQKILIDREQPGNILEETRNFMAGEGIVNTNADTDKKFAAYIYTRYSRAKKNVIKQMIAMGYGM